MDKKTVKRGGDEREYREREREEERRKGDFSGGGRGLERMEGGASSWRVLPSFSRIGRRREQRGGGGGGGGIAIKSIWHNLR